MSMKFNVLISVGECPQSLAHRFINPLEFMTVVSLLYQLNLVTRVVIRSRVVTIQEKTWLSGWRKPGNGCCLGSRPSERFPVCLSK